MLFKKKKKNQNQNYSITYWYLKKIPPSSIPIQSAIGWHPPNNPIFNANFDGAIFSYINVSGIGVVILDYNGPVISAFVSMNLITFLYGGSGSFSELESSIC